jgi:hypothetical protein
MVQAFIYAREPNSTEEGCLIMHRSFKHSTTQKVMDYMEKYIKEELINHKKEVYVRVIDDDFVLFSKLDLRDYK